MLVTLTPLVPVGQSADCGSAPQGSGLGRGGQFPWSALRQIRQQKRIAWRRLILLAEPQDGREGFVDSPLLVWTDPAHQIAQPSGVDRADLLN